MINVESERNLEDVVVDENGPNKYKLVKNANLGSIWQSLDHTKGGLGSWVKWFFMTQGCFYPTTI